MNEQLIKYKEHLHALNHTLVYFDKMKQFLDYCQNKQIDYTQITQENIINFFTEKGYAIETKNSFLSAGKDFYEFIGKSKEENVWNKIKSIRSTKTIPDFLTYDEVRTAIKYLSTYHTDRLMTSIKAEALLMFMFYGMCRKEELVTLKRKDINLVEGEAILFGKGRKERYAFFPLKFSKTLTEYFNSEPEETNAFNITVRQIDYLYCDVLRKYFPNKHIKPHLMRHSGARYWQEQGIPSTYIKEMLGHTSIQTTMIYLQVNQKQIKESIRKRVG